MKHEDLSAMKPDGTPYAHQVDDSQLREELDSLSYKVLRQAGTEAAFSGEYTDTETEGIYSCKVCSQELFRSETKFHSGCGWPSFYAPKDSDAVVLLEDRSFGARRVEARCANCGSHRGQIGRAHV